MTSYYKTNLVLLFLLSLVLSLPTICLANNLPIYTIGDKIANIPNGDGTITYWNVTAVHDDVTAEHNSKIYSNINKYSVAVSGNSTTTGTVLFGSAYKKFTLGSQEIIFYDQNNQEFYLTSDVDGTTPLTKEGIANDQAYYLKENFEVRYTGTDSYIFHIQGKMIHYAKDNKPHDHRGPHKFEFPFTLSVDDFTFTGTFTGLAEGDSILTSNMTSETSSTNYYIEWKVGPGTIDKYIIETDGSKTKI